jgi:hypothetical protein
VLWVLLDEKRQFDAQRRNHEHPVHKQNGPARPLGSDEVVKNNERSQPETHKSDHGFDDDLRARHVARGPRPFAQSAAVLGRQCAFSGMRTNGRQPEQSIEIEAG